MKVTEHQLKVFADRYQHNNETIEEAFRRIADLSAPKQTLKGTTTKAWAEIFYKGLINKQFTPAGRVFANLDKGYNNMLFNCFVIGIGDSRKEITDSLGDFMEIASKGGGIGSSFGNLRPKGDPTISSKGTASGPISFVNVFQELAVTIKQAGTRGLATLVTMPIYHPDIEEFIVAKYEEGKWPNANISIGITDAFMKCVEQDLDFELQWKNEVRKTIKAKELWNKICTLAHRNGEPGILFLDNMNVYSPYLGYEYLDSTNPCQPVDALLWDVDRLRYITDQEAKSWTSWKTGVKECVEVETNTGLKMVSTLDHKYLLVDGTMCEAQNLVGKQLTQPNQWLNVLTLKTPQFDNLEVVRGFLFGDGFEVRNHLGVCVKLNQEKEPEVTQMLLDFGFHKQGGNALYMNAKQVSAKIDVSFLSQKVYERTLPEDVLLGKPYSFLRGLYAANGSCNKNAGQISLKATNYKMIQKVQILLGAMGIHASIVVNKLATIKWANGIYTSKQSYNLQTPVSYAKRFQQFVGFFAQAKQANIRDSYYNKVKIIVKSVTPIGKLEVWDYRMNVAPHYNYCQGTILANCGEVPLPHNGACNLGSVIVSSFVDLETKEIDYAGISEAAYNLAIWLDSLIDISTFPTKKIEKMVKKYRPIGVGMMGLADALLYLDIPYGDNAASKTITENIAEVIYEGALQASKDLANEFGAFPAYSKEISPSILPRRNITLTSYAPTGSISALFDVSSGVEPLFAQKIKRNEEIGTTITQSGGLGRYMAYHNLTEIPAHARFSIAGPEGSEITTKDHLAILKALVPYVDSGISKTVILENNATVEDVSNVYKECWNFKSKGVTVYRTGSRKFVPIEDVNATETDADYEEIDVEFIDYSLSPKKRPNELSGATYKVKFNYNQHSMFITINDFEGELYEIFFKINNSIHQEYLDGLSRAITTLWRRGIDTSHLMEEFSEYESLSGGSFYEYKHGKKINLKSILHAISVVVKQHLEFLEVENAFIAKPVTKPEFEGEINGFSQKEKEITKVVTKEIQGDLCPNCKDHTLFRAEGCMTCISCGYSRCG